MATATLGPSSYIVLGFVSAFDQVTSYDIKRMVEGSVAYFWTFPHSQLYAEPQRLSALGYLTETQEEGGRRRRRFSLTAQGRAALDEWLSSPSTFPELRDPGLLRMFFMQDDDERLRDLAGQQLAMHEERLAEYDRQRESHGPGPHPPYLRTVRLGQLYEQANIAFWREVLDAESAGEGP